MQVIALILPGVKALVLNLPPQPPVVCGIPNIGFIQADVCDVYEAFRFRRRLFLAGVLTPTQFLLSFILKVGNKHGRSPVLPLGPFLLLVLLLKGVQQALLLPQGLKAALPERQDKVPCVGFAGADENIVRVQGIKRLE